MMLRARIDIGGVTSVIKNSIDTLSKLNVKTTIATIVLEDGALPKSYTSRNDVATLILPSQYETATSTLINYVREHNISLVICMGMWDIHYLASAVREHTQAKIANWYHTMPFYPKQVDKNKARKSILGFLTYYCLKLPLIHKLGIKNAFLWQYKHILVVYDYFIVLCPEYKDEIIARLKLTGEDAERVLSLINTIELNPSPTLQKRKEIAYLGRYSEEKQVLDLLKVWQRIHHQIPDWTLKLYGTGNEEQMLKDFASKHQLPRVEFMGYTSDVQSVYDRTAIVCLTSVYEGWPMMLIEAQNNGVIPISYHCADGIKSIIGKDAGILVEDGNISEFSKALCALAQDEKKRERMQAACLEKRMDYAPDINNEVWRTLLGL